MSDNSIEQIPFEAPAIEELDNLLPGYEFESFLAQGGMGAVYLARQTSLDREVAIKILPRELGDDISFRESFQNEAKHMAKLNHPNLIGIYDFGDIDGMLYIIMEFVKGKSLYDAAAGNAILQERAATIVRDVCRGLDHAHEAGILHRDIKPANILIGKGKTPKIGDFGLARPTGNVETGVIYGTPGYAAPEVLNEPDKVDARTDVFAVGIMLYELLTGAIPKETYIPVHNVSDVDQQFDNIIRKAIHTNPKMRYETADDLADDLDDVLKELEEKAKAPINPLLSGATGKTSLQQTSLNRLVATAPVKAKAATPLPASVQKSSSSGFAKNAVIILALLGALFVALKIKENKTDEQAQAEHDAEQKKLTTKNKELAKVQKQEKVDKNEIVTPIKKEDQIAEVEVIELPPLEHISSHQDSLARGHRLPEYFPKEIIARENGERKIMFIDKPMTWDEADQWANSYGAYIAVCKSSADITFLSKAIGDGKAWLGGGNNGSKGWVWVDGSPWENIADLGTTKKRAFVTLSSLGSINSESKQSQKYPFFIEWRMSEDSDGNINPGSVQARLERTSNEVGGLSLDPKYPAGSVSLGSRTYCPVYTSLNFSSANKLAERSGGHLLVISDEDEKIYLEQLLSNIVRKDMTCWIGGILKNDLWCWVTGEIWAPLTWDEGYPKAGNRVQLYTGDSIRLRNARTSSTAEMFIIEWSDDKDNAPKEEVNTTIDIDPMMQRLIDFHKKKVDKLKDDANRKYKNNIKKLTFDLGFHLKSLPKNQRAREEPIVKQIEGILENKERIPERLKNQGPSAKVRNMTKYAVDKQEEISKDIDEDFEKLHQSYLKHLAKYRKEMLEKGQKKIINSIDKAQNSVGKDAKSYRSYFEE